MASPTINRDEWLDRYAQRIVQQAGWTLDAAQDYVRNAEDFETLSDGYEEDPEGAADMEMSYWSD